MHMYAIHIHFMSISAPILNIFSMSIDVITLYEIFSFKVNVFSFESVILWDVDMKIAKEMK